MKRLVAIVALIALLAVPAFAEQWLAIWTEDDSWVGVADDGQMWQLVPGNLPNAVGSFGPGPWADFARKTIHPRQYFGLKPNGEIWTLGIFGPASLWRTLPSDREWCALELDQEAGYEPSWALSCDGEIWALTDPPQYVATLALPQTSAQPTSWGCLKGKFQ